MQARYYDPVIGRFYSNDPQGFRDVHSFNRFAYANNNPYKYVDPDGEATVYTWNAGKTATGSSKAGHAAVLSENGTYVSKFPSDGNGSKADFHKTFEQDVALYGRQPDVIIEVSLPDEAAANEFAAALISDSEQTWSLSDNCADATVSVLNAGGGNVFNKGLQSPASVDFNLKNAAKDDDKIKIIKDE